MHRSLTGYLVGLLVVLVYLMLFAVPVFASDTCTTGDEANLDLPPLEPGQLRAITREGQWKLVKPLDAPDNPYLGLYDEWDHWLVEHFDPNLDYAGLPPG